MDRRHKWDCVHAVGGFAVPYGIELVVDGSPVPSPCSWLSCRLGVLAYARQAGPHSGPFYGLYLLLIAGLTGMTVTGDGILYVFLELASLPSYALVGFLRTTVTPSRR